MRSEKYKLPNYSYYTIAIAMLATCLYAGLSFYDTDTSILDSLVFKFAAFAFLVFLAIFAVIPMFTAFLRVSTDRTLNSLEVFPAVFGLPKSLSDNRPWFGYAYYSLLILGAVAEIAAVFGFVLNEYNNHRRSSTPPPAAAASEIVEP